MDPESFVYECLSVEDVEKLLNESIECLCNSINCPPPLAKALLLEHRWSISDIVEKYRENATELLVRTRVLVAGKCVCVCVRMCVCEKEREREREIILTVLFVFKLDISPLEAKVHTKSVQ